MALGYPLSEELAKVDIWHHPEWTAEEKYIAFNRWIPCYYDHPDFTSTQHDTRTLDVRYHTPETSATNWTLQDMRTVIDPSAAARSDLLVITHLQDALLASTRSALLGDTSTWFPRLRMHYLLATRTAWHIPYGYSCLVQDRAELGGRQLNTIYLEGQNHFVSLASEPF